MHYLLRNSMRSSATPIRWVGLIVGIIGLMLIHEVRSLSKSISHQARMGRPPLKRARQDGKWLARYEELTTFKESKGHTDVPKRDESGLGLWVYTQRRQYRLLVAGEKSNMTQQRISLLRNIGFDFEPKAKANHPRKLLSWEERFLELVAFKEIHGHMNVPISVAPSLSRWITKQRYEYKSYKAGLKANIDDEKIKRLEQIGFEFKKRTKSNRHLKVLVEDGEAISKRFESNLELLKEFHHKKGHIDLPQTERYSDLNAWCREIRTDRGKKLLSNRMKEELQCMGFGLDKSKRKDNLQDESVVVRLKWVDRWKQLKNYKKEYGDCNVPNRYPPHPGLSKWCNMQRIEYQKMQSGEKSKMTDKRIEALQFLDSDFFRADEDIDKILSDYNFL